MTPIIYDSDQEGPICHVKCKNCSLPITPSAHFVCDIIDVTRSSSTGNLQNDTKSIQLIQRYRQNTTTTSCHSTCDIKSNYHYENYCIENGLLKPFINYNAFGQWGIYNNLKFITFFCKALKNTTACNHLANLCVASFYSLEKNSPCSIFLLAQTSEYAAVYSGDEYKNLQPFLFYKKEKDTVLDLTKTIDYSYKSSAESNRVSKFVGNNRGIDF